MGALDYYKREFFVNTDEVPLIDAGAVNVLNRHTVQLHVVSAALLVASLRVFLATNNIVLLLFIFIVLGVDVIYSISTIDHIKSNKYLFTCKTDLINKGINYIRILTGVNLLLLIGVTS